MERTDNERAVIGGNMPPPYVAMDTHIADLLETAKGFLDGEPIENEATALVVARLIDEGRKAAKDADNLRKDEAKPFDDGKKAVQARWKPIIDRAELIVSTAKKALVPYQLKLERDQADAAAKAREEADRARQEAIAAERAARDAADLEAAERADELRKAADRAQSVANRAEKAAPTVAVEGGRGIGLRSYWIAEITDALAFARWAWANRRTELLAALELIAKHEATGPKNIPGLTIHEDRRAA